MAKIFIGYKASHVKSVDFYGELERDLRERGHEVLGPSDADVGEPLRARVASYIAAADIVVFLLTPSAARSSWLAWEAKLADSHSQRSGKPAILPLSIGKEERRFLVPRFLREYLSQHVKSPSEAAELIDQASASILGRQLADEEKREAVRVQVKETAAEYIQASLDELRDRESRYRRTAHWWYLSGYSSLVVGIAVAVWRATQGFPEDTSWPTYAQFFTLIVVAIALLGAIARFSFLLGKSYAVEALRNSDRIHAIRFGEFYLNAFGPDVDWGEVKEAFQHWNIGAGSAFAEQKVSDINPEVLGRIADIAKIITGKKPGGK
ncbi:MAG: toll/interleukin-1 receptor domain-containing protein [Acidobacteriota bacterium]